MSGQMRKLGIAVFLLAAIGSIVYLLATAGLSGAVLAIVAMQAVLVSGFLLMVRFIDRRPDIHASVGRLVLFGVVCAFVLGAFVYTVVAAPDRDNAAIAAVTAVQVVGFLAYFMGTVAGRRSDHVRSV